jgi:iron complex outermembrane receptor protein
MVNYGKQHSDGFTLHNQSNKEFVNVIANFQPNEKQTIYTYFGYSNSKDERAGELTITQFDTEDYSGNPEYIKRNGHSNVATFRAGINHNFEFNKHLSNSTTVFGTGFASNVSSAGGWTDKSSINYGIRSTFQTRFNFSDNITLNGVTGIEWQNQIAQTIGYSMKKDPFDTSSTWVLGVNPYWVINAATSNVYSVANTKSLFSEWTLNLPKEFSITAGIGSSTQGLLLNDRFNTALTTKPSNFDTTYKNMVSPHIAINKVFNKHFSVFASYSKGYKAPVSSYFYITTPAVTTPATPATGSLNRLLQPEIGNQFEIGHRGQLDNNKLSYELIYFNTVFSNKMTAISVQSPASATTTLYTYMVNGGKQIHKGIEALVKYTVYSSDKNLVRLVRPFANVTRSNFVYGDNFKIQKSVVLTEDYSNKAVAGISKYVVNLGTDVSFCGGFYANITYNYRDKMPITSMNDFYTASYNLLNGKLGMQKSIGKHLLLDASFGINNMTNTKYALMVFANQLPDTYVPAARNANYFGNLQLKYEF